MAGAIEQLFPMVFSCNTCNAIVSDSTEYLCSYEDMNCIVMAGGTNIRIATESSLSPIKGQDSFGYYQQIFCSKCNAWLGKRYHSGVMQHLVAKGRICLTVTALESYRLGTGEVRAGDRPPAQAREATPDGAAAPESTSLQQRIAELEVDLVKVQNMVLLHQERLEALEGGR